MPRVIDDNDPVTPFWATPDGTRGRLYLGHVPHLLGQLPPRSVHCVVTSPPYWGLRDYGPSARFPTEARAAAWSAAEAARLNREQHHGGTVRWLNRGASYDPAGKEWVGRVGCEQQWAPGRWCALGGEPLPDCLAWARKPFVPCGGCFVCNLVAVFRAVRRVLRDDGTLWLNLGDSYSTRGGGSVRSEGRAGLGVQDRQRNGKPEGFGHSQLIGVPWRVALALQADGWVLRQDVIWHKPSPMPESVKNRCTKAHEYVFLLAKGPGYYYDAEAVKDRSTPCVRVQKTGPGFKGKLNRTSMTANGVAPEDAWGNGVEGSVIATGKMANKRSVWTVASAGYPGAHFATFPPKLVEPCILAGTSKKGACAQCGAPWRRVTEQLGYSKTDTTRKRGNTKGTGNGEHDQGNDINKTGGGHWSVRTLGWEPTCECHGRFEAEQGPAPRAPAKAVPGWAGSNKGALNVKHVLDQLSDTVNKTTRVYVPSIPLAQHPVVPCVVLDPFVGSGTTVCVALEYGRAGWGIDLSEQYLRANAVPRIADHLKRAGLLRLLDPYATARAREREAARAQASGRDGTTV